MWSFWFGLLFICDLPSIKAAPLLYYTSVLILTKITILFSLWEPYWALPRGLMKLKDRDYLRAQHISWSLVLLPSRNYRTFASPSEYQLCPSSTSDSFVDQFLTEHQKLIIWYLGMTPIPCNNKTPKYSAIKLSLLQIKNTRYSGSNMPIFMHFSQDLVTYAYFLFAIFISEFGGGSHYMKKTINN